MVTPVPRHTAYRESRLSAAASVLAELSQRSNLCFAACHSTQRCRKQAMSRCRSLHSGKVSKCSSGQELDNPALPCTSTSAEKRLVVGCCLAQRSSKMLQRGRSLYPVDETTRVLQDFGGGNHSLPHHDRTRAVQNYATSPGSLKPLQASHERSWGSDK